MSGFTFSGVFMLSFMVSCFGQYYGGIQSVVEEELEDYGSVNLLDFGSNLASLGKPKFKITETEYGSGWSIYIGYGNNKYIRFNYGDILSIDINILNHKGSLKLIDSDYLNRHVDDDSITIEGDMTEQHPCIWCIVDGRIKMKLSFRDQIVLDISINNDANIRGAYIQLPTARVTEIESIDMSMRLVIDTANPLESKLDGNFHINAKKMRHLRDYNREYSPGHYNLTASMKLTQIDDLRNEFPKFNAKLDIAEHIQIQGADVSQLKEPFQRSLNIDGMINLSRTGKRLAVLRLSDADTERMIGRIEARFTDKDNIKAELFVMGESLGSINWHTTDNSSEVFLQRNHYCLPDWVYEPIEDPTEGYGNRSESDTGDYSDSLPEYNNQTEYQPHLDESIGWYSEDVEEENDNCNIIRLWRTTFNDTQVTTSFYKNAFVSDSDRYNWKKLTGNPDWTFVEEHISLKDDGYDYNMTFPDGDEDLFTMSVRNRSENTLLHVSTFSSRVEIQNDQNNSEKFKTKAYFGSEKVLDGWLYDVFGFSKNLDDILLNVIPSYLESYSKITRAKEWHTYIYTIGQVV